MNDDFSESHSTTSVEDNEDTTSDSNNVRSTKRPLKITNTKAAKLRREAQEDILLQKAVSCMETATRRNVKEKDDDDIFAQFIASELRSIEDTIVRRRRRNRTVWVREWITQLKDQVTDSVVYS